MKNSEKNSEEGKAKRLKNLAPPFEKGHEPLPGGGRPKGSRNWKTIVKEFLQTRDAKTGKLHVELLGENTVKRAINKGGHDLDIILDRIDGAVPGELIVKGPLDGLTNEEVKALAEIRLAQRKRLKN